MRRILTILLIAFSATTYGQGILVGYVKSSGSTTTANAALTNINTPVYSRYRTFSQIAEGDTLYANIGLTTRLAGNSEWWGYNTTSGGNTSYRSYKILNTGIVQFITTHHTAYTHYLNFGGDCSVTSASANDAEAVSADDDTSIYVGKRTIKWNGADFSNGTAAAVLKVRTGGLAYYQITFGTVSKIATVTKCALANQAPIPNAGADQNIALPTNFVTLNGSASFDPDGSIVKYEWLKINTTSSSSVLKTLDFENPSVQIPQWVQILASGYPGYSLVLDSTIKRAGIASGKFTLNASDAALTPSYTHSDLNLAPETNPDRWYGFSEYLPSPYLSDPEPEIHSQWHEVQDVGDAVGAPPISVLIRNDSMFLNILYSAPAIQTPANTTQVQFYMGQVVRNVWTDWVFHIKYSYTSTGLIEVWKDGTKIINYAGPNCYNDAQLPYWVIGIYKWPWATTNVSTVTQRQAYYDEVRQGDQTAVYQNVQPYYGIMSPFSPITDVRGFDFGLHSFSLAVTDNNGLTRKDTVDVTVQPAGGTTVVGKLLVNYLWSWQNNSFVGDLKPMFDGNLNTFAFTGYNWMLNPCWVVIDVPDSFQLDLSKIRLYGGSGWSGKTLDIYYNDTASGHLIGSYPGNGNVWTEYSLGSPVRIHQIWMRKWKLGSNADALPAEFELVGTYRAYVEPPLRQRTPRTYDYVAAGINHHIWHVIQNSRYGWNDVPYQPKLDIIERLATHTRPYIDANYLNPTQNTYTFNPTPNGNYNIDTLLWALKVRGISAMPCIKTCPPWMTGKGYSEAVPAWPDDPTFANFSSPTSYIDFGKLMWQFAKRYGHDTTKFNKIKVDPNYRAYTNGPLNQARAGLGWIDEMEVENERDKSWKGRGAFQTPFEYAAMLSACWDGHKGTLGDTVGVHNADPTMRLVVAGLAQADQDYFRGIVDWWRRNRNEEIPSLIVFNFHDYSNDGEQNNSTRGVPPETGKVVENIQEIRYGTQTASGDSNRLIYDSEYSQGTHKISGQGVHSIGTHNQEEVSAWWENRQSLLNWVYGIDKAFPYELFDDQPHTFGQYAMSGFAVSEMEIKTVFEYAVQQIRNLKGVDTPILISTSPWVIKGRRNNRDVYTAWMGTEKDSVTTYVINRNAGENYIKFYTLAKGKLVSDVSFVPFVGNSYTLTVRESPIYWEKVAAQQTFTTPVANAGVDQTITLPVGEIALNSTGSSTGTGIEYYWQKLSGPEGVNIWAPLESTTQVTNLFAGVYKFTLKVWNSDGIMTIDTMQLTVNPVAGNIAPVANAGVNVSITLPADHIDLVNPGATDADGFITQNWWRPLSGPIDWNLRFPNSLHPRFDNYLPGIYQFEYTAVDNKGSIGRDTVQVTVLSTTGNIPPTCNAGSPQTVIGLQVTLSGAASDADGTFTVNWTTVSGPAGSVISIPNNLTTTVTGLTTGIYTFRLTATDNAGATSTSDVVITVFAPTGAVRFYKRVNIN